MGSFARASSGQTLGSPVILRLIARRQTGWAIQKFGSSRMWWCPSQKASAASRCVDIVERDLRIGTTMQTRWNDGKFTGGLHGMVWTSSATVRRYLHFLV